MGIQDEILHLLKNETLPVSGEDLAKKLSVSRNSIWKAVQKLKTEGYQISAVTNQGYQLVSIGNALTVEEVRTRLPKELQTIPMEVCETVTSTNTKLKEVGENDFLGEKILIAQEQTAGRGRLGRSFYSPHKTGLYISMLLRPCCLAEEALYLTTAAAVAVCKAIEEVTAHTPKIKWVNDIYIDKKKVCGILSEASMNFETNSLNYAVVGIGINVETPKVGFLPELQEIATALYSSSAPDGIRALLAAAVIRNFYYYYKEKNKKLHMEAYRERSFLTGYHVIVNAGNIAEAGIVTGVDDKARLLVDLDNGKKRCYSAGEVQLDKNFWR